MTPVPPFPAPEIQFNFGNSKRKIPHERAQNNSVLGGFPTCMFMDEISYTPEITYLLIRPLQPSPLMPPSMTAQQECQV